MAAYNEIAKELEKSIALMNKGDNVVAKLRLQKLYDKVIAKKKENTAKVLKCRRNSRRAQKLHTIDNKLLYARKTGNAELLAKILEEKEYVKNNIFD